MDQPGPFVYGIVHDCYGSPDFYPVPHQGENTRSPAVLPGQTLMGFITGNALALMSSAVVWQCHSLHLCLALGKAHRRLTVCMTLLKLKGNLTLETQNLSTCSCLPGFFFFFETFDCFKLRIKKLGLTALPIVFSNPERHNA